ncbi:MAG: hypothetical protein IJ055_10045 [Oscillospiraceae bacterium]|nr:hypothetical protein [Oscillospiraceae bacterium]
MKRLLLCLPLLCCLTACSSPVQEAPAVQESVQSDAAPDFSALPGADPSVDIDLTAMSGTMVYSQVYDMAYAPDAYIGRSVKVTGPFAVYHDESNGQDYFAVLIPDAAACCTQGMEFDWEGHTYPDDYPEEGSQITVSGTFSTYEENGTTYCCLLHAQLETAQA